MKREKQRSPTALEESRAINTRAEEKKVEERLAIVSHIVYETIRREGAEEFKRSPAALAWSGIRRGAFHRLLAGGGSAAGCPLAARVMGAADFKIRI